MGGGIGPTYFLLGLVVLVLVFLITKLILKNRNKK